MFSTLEAHMTKKNTAHGIFGTCISLYLFLKDKFLVWNYKDSDTC